MSTALILRPATSPRIHVLEVDGRRHNSREDGYYRLATDNHPNCYLRDQLPDPRLKDWEQPHWEILQHHNGRVEITSNRPTIQEVMRGDLHGRWGSSIFPKSHRFAFKIALRIARRLCRCNPIEGITLQWHEAAHLWKIQTDIPVYQTNPSGHSITVPKSA